MRAHVFGAHAFPQPSCILLFDEEGRKLYPVAKSFINDPDIPVYDWSDDNLHEVELGILKCADTREELARAMNVDCATLEQTLAEWNALCHSEAQDR